jgi:hypothetical protein
MADPKSERLDPIVLTKGELLLAIEAVGAYKPRLRSKAAVMARKRGVNHLGRSHQRLSRIQSLQAKLTEANDHGPVDMPEGYRKRRNKQWQNKNNQTTE